MAKFKRKYELVIGRPYSITREEIINGPQVPYPSKLKAIEDSVHDASQGSDGYLITDHHIEFSIEKTKSGVSANKASITLFNTSPKIISYLENLTSKKSIIMLKAGYEGEPLNKVFIGNLEKYVDTFNRETRKTILHLSDGGVNFQESTTSRYYPAGTSVDAIINDLISDTYLPKSGSNVYSLDLPTEKAWYFNGSTIAELNKLAKYYEFNFSVQDGLCYWTPAGKVRDVNAILININTGLIGDVTTIDATQGFSQNSSSDTNPGIKFKTLLNGLILPETVLKIESRNKTGVYKVTKVVHKGILEGQDWYSEVEAEEVEAI